MSFDLPHNWETELERMMIQRQTENGIRRGYIASPCKAETPEELCLNMKAARFYLYYAHTQLGARTWAPQAFLPPLLSDHVAEERKVAIDLGAVLLEQSNSLRLCGRWLSAGMRMEMEYAAALGLTIFVYDYPLYQEVQRVLRAKFGTPGNITYNEGHPMLAFSAKELFGEEGYYA